MNAILTMLKLLPAIIAAMRDVEDQIPETGQGAVKRAAILAAIEAVWDLAVEALGAFEAFRPRLERVIGAIVEAANKTGLFGRKAKP